MIEAKEIGGEKFSKAFEAGERLYPSTSTEGREVIRQQLRDLREQWETYCDNLNDTLRHLDTTLAQVIKSIDQELTIKSTSCMHFILIF